MLMSQVKSSSRESLQNFLARNDPNGAYTDKDLRMEFGSDYTLPTKEQAMAEVYYVLIQGTDLVKLGEKVTLDQYVAAYVRTVIEEVGTEIKAKRIPKKVSSFSELHDYDDANLLGGAAFMLSLLSTQEEALRVLNLGQDIVDLWLKMGHVDSPHPTY